MKDPLKPRDKITQKMTRDGAIAENQTTGETERISNRIRDADLQKTPEQQAAQDAMKIPSTLALLQDMLERQAASAQKTAERLGDIQAELQEAGTHIQRAGRTLLGRPEPEDAEYEQNKGLLGKAQTFMGRMCDSLSSMAARTAQLVDRLTAERETLDSRHSVKEALRDLQAEQKYGEDFPVPAEPAR